MSIIKIVCSWCKKNLGEKDGEGETGISHGMCPECLKKMKDEVNVYFKSGEVKT